MMKDKKCFKHLSARVGLLAALQLGLMVWMVARSLLPAKLDDSAAFAGLLIPIVCQGVLCGVFYVWVLCPYRRSEKRMKLFLEGYSLSVLDDPALVSISPVSAQMMERYKEEFNASTLLKFSKRQAQYHALQNQINPHFLYNTLESIRSEALVAGLDNVAEMTEALAVFFRYTISKLENLVSVEEELQNCITYFRIQQYRFGPRLKLNIECDPADKQDLYRCRIPKLTLQPILENSIIHGTEMKIDSGRLTVHLEKTEKLLKITVSDDGAGMNESKLSQLNSRLTKNERLLQKEPEGEGGVALVNVNNRIHLLFGEAYGLHVFSMPMVGTDVQITLPAITSDRELSGEALP